MSHLYFTLVFLSQMLSCFCEFNVIELDHDLGHDTPYFILPGTVPFSYEVIEASNNRGFWLAFGKYIVNDNSGTHVIAPYQGYEQGITVDQIPAEQYFGEASVIDVRDKVAKGDAEGRIYDVSEQDVRDWISRHGMFPNNSFVLINTGWDVGRYPNHTAYISGERGIRYWRYPGVSRAAMETMLSFEKSYGINIIAFGIDSAGFGFISETRQLVSAIFNRLNKYGIRNLRDLKRLPPTGARLMVLPLKIRNAPSAQARVLARLP